MRYFIDAKVGYLTLKQDIKTFFGSYNKSLFKRLNPLSDKGGRPANAVGGNFSLNLLKLEKQILQKEMENADQKNAGLQPNNEFLKQS